MALILRKLQSRFRYNLFFGSCHAELVEAPLQKKYFRFNRVYITKLGAFGK